MIIKTAYCTMKLHKNHNKDLKVKHIMYTQETLTRLHFNDPKAFVVYSNNMQDVYKSNE